MRAVFGLPSRTGRFGQEDQAHYTGMTSLQEVGGRAYKYAEVVAALTRAIAETWAVALIPAQLTAAESQLSTYLRATKYCSQAWTWHR
jgi:lipoate-protein ligase A